MSYNWKNYIKIEPRGGEGGNKKWSFRPNGGITEIKIGYAAVIDSISFKSIDENGMITSSEKFGGNVWKNEEIILFNWPKEYLMKISGTQRTYANVYCIESLCFHTNLNKYGPFGPSNATSFELCMKDGVIVGFHGRCGIYIDAIGVYVKNYADLFSPPSQEQKMIPQDMSYNWNNSITVGPWGGEGGNMIWSFKPNGGIREIKIGFVKIIDSISFKGVDENGMYTSSEIFGGHGEKTEKTIVLNWPEEYLTKISGTLKTQYEKAYCIESLCFHTNLNKYGPFGPTNGTPFELCMKDGVIVGFHGRSGVYINAIGVYVKNSADLCGPSSPVQILTPQVNTGKMMNMDTPRELGPWGGNDTAKPWDDGVFLDINQVDVHVKKGILLGIQFRYQTKNGNSVESERHGEKSGDALSRENSCNWENSITLGPCSNRPAGDHEWSYKPNGGITEIKLRRGVLIESITFKSIDWKGNIETSNKFGGDAGCIEHVISLNWPEEYLMKLSGTSVTYAEFPGIESLCFETNLKKYGPFGNTDGTPFEFSVKDGVIVGFHGRFGIYVNTIGVYVKKLFRPSGQLLDGVIDGFHGRSGVYINARGVCVKNSADLCGPTSPVQILTPQVNTSKMMNMDTPRELGPWGGNDTAKPWDDGVFLDINQVDVHVKKGILLGIQFRYQTKNGNSVESERHGEKNGDALYRIKLDRSSEYLIGIMGYYRPIEGNGGFKAVCSLSFYTNKGKYGPFGDQIGMFFSSMVTNGKIIGFHGRSGDYLDALGVHMEYY
ncbi:hypothetical protein LWI29_000368 [Acer saccharum]|uniref:Jacalin-type lectin domain-containing protein n=1 Tax=Acer saccharum TaxID=4024 RepID=A0AA39RM90_ACESA|nr:hypothetical protein LWI29_000368 [Acer saccharum]